MILRKGISDCGIVFFVKSSFLYDFALDTNIS